MTDTRSDVNSVLLGTNGSPVLKFPQGQFPVVYKGTVVDSGVRQATDINQVPKTFNDGSPKLEVVITLQTDERDPAVDDDDDGQRRLIAGYEMQKAIGQAMRDAGCRSLDLGGTLAVQYFADKPAEKAGFSPTKLFRAEYRPPAAGAGVNDSLLGASGPAPAPDATTPQPVPPQPPAAAAPAAQPASSLL